MDQAARRMPVAESIWFSDCDDAFVLRGLLRREVAEDFRFHLFREVGAAISVALETPRTTGG